MEEMEKRSDRHIRDLVAHTAFKGLDANEIGCARISVMAGEPPFKGPNTDEQDQLSPDLQIRLATRCDIALPYSMTSSARASSVGGTVRPRDRRCTPLFKPDWPAPAPIRCRRAVCQFD